MASSKRAEFFVDASSVCLKNTTKGVSLAALLTLLVELRKRGGDFICVWEASLRREIRDNCKEPDAAEIFESLPGLLPGKFLQVKSIADMCTLHAKRGSPPLISNNQLLEEILNPKHLIRAFVWNRKLKLTDLNQDSPLFDLKFSVPVEYDLWKLYKLLETNQSG